MKRALLRFGSLVILLCLLAPSGVLALDKMEADLKVKEAALALERFMTSPDKDAPLYLLKKCKAVVIVPNMVKAGFVVGGEYGNGVILARTGKGWSLPAFVTMAGANLGIQIGAQSTDLLLMVMNQKGLDGIMKNRVKFGADAAATAGPVGREAEAALAGASLDADMYSYSRSKGAYAGVTLDGVAMETDVSADKAYYGRKTSAKALLKGDMGVKAPKSAHELISVLKKYGG